MEPEQKSWTSDFVAAMRAFYGELSPELDVATDPVALGMLSLKWLLPVKALSVPGVSRAVHWGLGHISLGLSCNVPLRTAAIDAALRRELAAGTRQLVILGAGLDARAYRLPELAEARVFEVDHPATSRVKERLVQGLTPLAREVRSIQVDFERDSLEEALREADFRAAEPSVWIWEGVTMYLTRSAQLATLGAIANQSAPGSALCMTYLPPWRGALRRVSYFALGKLGEPILGEIPREDVARALSERGFDVTHDTDGLDWAQRYWPASERSLVQVWERLAVARRRS
ncbi:MAG: SAM-dependent methyltransferase [Polyangiaceae bacterium]|nr:SAM-dependent methyltransferase [Polyangiaceae bacterium]MCW5789982.1 SAM-dependent methyltransferase [Polyangiaceae bacterium]